MKNRNATIKKQKQKKPHCKKKNGQICKRGFSNDDKNTVKFQIIKKFPKEIKILKQIPVVFYNGSNCYYHLIIRQLAEEFGRQLKCLGRNTGKCIKFSVPIKKEHENYKKIANKIKFNDSVRFMTSEPLNLADNLAEGIQEVKCIDWIVNFVLNM